MSRSFKSLETKLVHAGEPEPRIRGSVALPIFQTAMYLYAGEKDYHDLRYIRLNNTPNHVALHRKLASLETLLTLPATTSHLGMKPEDRRKLGITDALIRVSVGIESTEDLLEDFDRALKKSVA